MNVYRIVGTLDEEGLIITLDTWLVENETNRHLTIVHEAVQGVALFKQRKILNKYDLNEFECSGSLENIINVCVFFENENKINAYKNEVRNTIKSILTDYENKLSKLKNIIKFVS